MKKSYKAIFFDWDGTAVVSRSAPAEKAAEAMGRLLKQGIKLAVISGTTMEKIDGGRLYERFSPEERKNLYFGLGRGAYNYRFREDGRPCLFEERIPSMEELIKIHKSCFDFHVKLLEKYHYQTDIVFSRPNYCKIDLMVEHDRADRLFFQADELQMLENGLKEHGFTGGIHALSELMRWAGKDNGMEILVTSDAKYLEAGISSKSDNVNAILRYLEENEGIRPEECSFWGDEYVGLDEETYGSDSFMITRLTAGADFYDVSDAQGKRPDGVKVLHGGVDTFLTFLKEQAGENGAI